MPLIAAVLAFVASLLLLSATWVQLTASNRAVRERISRYVEYERDSLATGLAVLPGPGLTGWRAVIRAVSRHFESLKITRPLERCLIQAGLPLRGSEFLVLCLGCAALAAILLMLLSGGRAAHGVLGAVVGLAVPVVILRVKAQRRIKQLSDQLGDALVLVANSLRTGYSFLQAVELVSREMPAPIAVEFGRLLRELNLGVTAEDALNNLARRLGSDDVDLVVTAVLIQRQLGGNLAEVLENIATTIRARIKLKGDVKVLTAQGRISGLILSILPVLVGLAIYFLNPDYLLPLFTHPIGLMMLSLAAAGQIVGALIIRKIVNVRL